KIVRSTEDEGAFLAICVISRAGLRGRCPLENTDLEIALRVFLDVLYQVVGVAERLFELVIERGIRDRLPQRSLLVVDPRDHAVERPGGHGELLGKRGEPLRG